MAYSLKFRYQQYVLGSTTVHVKVIMQHVKSCGYLKGIYFFFNVKYNPDRIFLYFDLNFMYLFLSDKT